MKTKEPKYLYDNNGYIIAKVSDEDKLANAKLISAAPDLLRDEKDNRIIDDIILFRT